MNRINIIPQPNKITYLGGEVSVEELETTVQISDSLAEEEYILTVDNDGIKLIAGSKKGEFYGRQSIAQLGKICPCVTIEDKPAYKYRGFMLDTVRHIISLDETKKMIDAAASVKMNVMHWHLTDDQGFRMFIESRPEAATLGSVRDHSGFGTLKEIGEYSGYFTKSELREIVDYCAERHITVIPEFDIPGHCSALLHAYPEISCKGTPVAVKTHQGIFEDILCAGKEKTFEIVFDILSEMLEIFPSEYIHIGGDEAPKARWKECPDCQKKIRELGLKNEEALQGWFTNRIIDFIEEKGRKAIVWNESLKGGNLKTSATVQKWMDRKNLSSDYANAGGKVIVSEFFHYYCDYPYGMTPLIKTYNYNPVHKGVKKPENIIGVEATIWTEYINNFDKLCYMCFPRFTAVAETGWTLPENRNHSDFIRRFIAYTETLDKFGIKPASPEEWNPSLFGRLSKSLSFVNSIRHRA